MAGWRYRMQWSRAKAYNNRQWGTHGSCACEYSLFGPEEPGGPEGPGGP
jgi:hypothetical protein